MSFTRLELGMTLRDAGKYAEAADVFQAALYEGSRRNCGRAADPMRPRKEDDIANSCIYVDADGCPVKREVYRVAERLEVRVVLVANQWLRAPEREWIETIVVEDRFDAADDWIAERAGEGDVVVTADVPLASRCVANGARVLDPRGREFEEGSIGDAVAQRDLMAQLREAGVVTGGPAPFEKRDRSRFLQTLDRILQKIRRDAER